LNWQVHFFHIEETKMTRRAVIYIRASSETQGEKSSSVEQEADCRLLAEEKGMKANDFMRICWLKK